VVATVRTRGVADEEGYGPGWVGGDGGMEDVAAQEAGCAGAVV